MKDNIVDFKKKKREFDKKDMNNFISIGDINIHLSISPDGTQLCFVLSQDLEEYLTDNVLENINDMLKRRFPNSLDELFELYKSNQ